MIIRAPRPDAGFLLVRNEVVRDNRLSLKARGLLLLILSYPDNWSTSAEQLAGENQEGRTAILSALQELRSIGYIRQTKTRNEKGQITTETYVYDRPESHQPESENLTPVPTRANGSNHLVAPEAGFPESGFPTPIEDLQKKELTNGADPLFAAFYDAYPRHIARGAALKAWKSAVKKTDPELIINAARAFARSRNGSDPRFIPHPATWLNAERWLDQEPQPTAAGRPHPKLEWMS